jgi:hypothetical protein
VDIIRSVRLDVEDVDSKTRSLARPKSRNSATDKTTDVEARKATKKPRKTAAKKDHAAIGGAEITRLGKPWTKKLDAEAGEDDVAKAKAPCKSRTKKVETGDDTTKEKAARRPRAKKRDGDTQTKLPNSQVTKVSTSKGEKDATSTKSQKDAVIKIDPLPNCLDYGLAEAVKRRTDWTPPPLTTKNASLTTPVPMKLLDGGLTSGGSRASEERGNSFRELLGKFGFSKFESNTMERLVPDGAGTRKRKLIELVKTNLCTSTTALKAKAPKKKPRTITELATSAYAEDDEDSAKAAPLLQYFSLETTDRVTSDGFKVPPKPRSKSPVKAGKGTAQAPILLSPESALKQVVNQDFVFGTSSQLAREESPGFLRDIHAAMQASNEMDNDDPYVSSSPLRLRGKSKALSLMKRNLWSAAARDGTGQLLDVEMVDLVDSPAVARQFNAAALSKNASSESRKADDEPWHDVEELVQAPTDMKMIDNSPKAVGPVETANILELLSSPSSSFRSAKSPAKPSTQLKVPSLKLATEAQASKTTKANKSKELKRPDFSAYTTVQLCKEVASYHFKPVKSRDQMIALLEKCWEGKQRLALGTLATNLPTSSPKKPAKPVSVAPPSSQTQVASPKTPRGRPKNDSRTTPSPRRKTKTASVANALARARKAQKKAKAVDEISDSDSAPTPSPPRRHPSLVGTPPLSLQLSPSATIDTRELSPASSQVRLFKYITTAVKSAPPSADSSNPSWHEKILLYDPIILEDLTVWLNTGALEKAGWDGEVDSKEVKKWCESKSICCLWKENLRGGTRSRY